MDLYVSRLMFPHVYRADHYFDTPWFGVVFDIENLSAEDRLRWLKSGHYRSEKLVKARSRFAPRVTEINSRYADLKAIFDEMEVRNMPRDLLLTDAPAMLGIEWYGVTRSDSRVTEALALNSISISIQDLRIP